MAFPPLSAADIGDDTLSLAGLDTGSLNVVCMYIERALYWLELIGFFCQSEVEYLALGSARSGASRKSALCTQDLKIVHSL